MIYIYSTCVRLAHREYTIPVTFTLSIVYIVMQTLCISKTTIATHHNSRKAAHRSKDIRPLKLENGNKDKLTIVMRGLNHVIDLI